MKSCPIQASSKRANVQICGGALLYLNDIRTVFGLGSDSILFAATRGGKMVNDYKSKT